MLIEKMKQSTIYKLFKIKHLQNISLSCIFVAFLGVIFLFMSSCAPKIYLPKQNVNEIEGEASNSNGDDIAPAREKNAECLKIDGLKLEDSSKVLSSSSFIKKLFHFDDKNSDHTLKVVIGNMTKSVESLYFTDTRSGFASFSHPPAAEYLMGQNLPFDKNDNAGGTDIFYFAPDKNDDVRFRSFSPINSPYWDSHPIAITQTNSDGVCITLLIFSSDRNNPFSKAINLYGDTIYGGSTDLFYSFGRFKKSSNKQINDDDFLNFEWSDAKQLNGANSSNYNDGSPFVYCQCCNPTLFFSSNRGNTSILDYDIYAAKLEIDFDELNINVISTPELLDAKSPTTDSLTLSINTIADERFPFVPFPHLENAADNPIYFSSDRNRKPEIKDCDCERGNDRTENIGGYDIYKYSLPEKYNCPKGLPPVPEVFDPDLYVDVALINLTNPDEPVKDGMLNVFNDLGDLVHEYYGKNNIKIPLKFGEKYSITGGSKFNSMDCSIDDEIIFRGYKAPSEVFYEKQPDSLTQLEVLTGFTMNSKDFIKINQDITKNESGNIVEKGIKLNSKDDINEKIINARIVGDTVYYDKQITIKKIWNRITIRPIEQSYEFGSETALVGGVRSIATMNDLLSIEMPKSNKQIVIYDTVYVLPDYIIKPPCYCEFAGIMTNYQQNVPYFQTGFWEVNNLSNYRRDIRLLDASKYKEARWIELHKDNQYFGEGRNGRIARINEYESYARTVDSNLFKMAEMISNKIIPAFKIIDSISPGSKLIISLDAWSDRRPVKRGWYIGDDVNYVEGSLSEGLRDYDIDFQKVMIKDQSSLNMNNDTLSRLRAYYSYRELLKKLLDTSSVGTGFYDYYKNGLALLPDDEKLLNVSLNKPFSLQSIEELIFKSKVIIVAKGNYFDPTEYKVPLYIRDIDSSLFMLDTIRRIDVRINTLEYQAGKLVKSPCCNEFLPCVDYNNLLEFNKFIPESNTVNPRKREKSKR